MNIIVTGTPGTGKTTIAKKIAKLLKLNYIDVNIIIKKHKLDKEYDKKRKCYVIDIPKLKKVLIPILKAGNVVIDSHLSHYLNKKYADLCIVTKCSDLKKLKQRLIKRGYRKDKIQENIECEIFEICHLEAIEKEHKILVVDTAKKFNLSNSLQKLDFIHHSI